MRFNKWKNFIIVGSGNIGTRLMQSLISTLCDERASARIYCSDPHQASLELARSRAAEILNRHPDHAIELDFAQDLGFLPEQADLAIIATPSDIRCKVLLDLLDCCRPKRVLLEKFLFTQWTAYETASRALASSDARAFVHVPRGVWPGYVQLRRRVAPAERLTVEVAGASWAMASNAIHFIHLLEVLTGDTATRIDGSKLSPVTLQSRRKGYLEVGGEIEVATMGGSTMRIVCEAGPRIPPLVRIQASDWHAEVHEAEGRMLIRETGSAGPAEQPFQMLVASQMQAPLRALLEGRECGLPSYESQIFCHLELMKAFNRVFYGEDAAKRDCPVT